MTTIDFMVRTGWATRAGTAEPSGDAVVVRVLPDGTTAAAVVDGIGHSAEVAETAGLLAAVAARVTGRRGPLAGLLSAAELIADTGAGADSEADAVAAVAVAEPGGEVRVGWIGDCRAYALEDGGELVQLTHDHNLADQLELCGYTGEVLRSAGQWVRTTVATATVATVGEAWTQAPVVLLTTDGVHDQVPHEEMARLARRHEDDPQALADALVAAATADDSGVRDDATASVLVLPVRPATAPR
ncbi:protein phosphatase 2C domain-containing protein [Streptomyces xiamenensis]|uniref:protein phosphatase 2C domain-containing protein n=1 Tax=Streptomyces xiamenensis TaxID=408015 RepID=UPI0036E9C4CB